MIGVVRDHPYGTAAALYVLVVLALWGGSHFLTLAPRDYLATRELVANHRIVAGDFRPPDGFPSTLGFYLPPASSLEGKYVRTGAIPPGGLIQPDALKPEPDLTLPANHQALVFALPSAAGLTALLDAGSVVLVMGADDDKAAVSFAATVHAVLCDAKKDDAQACRAVLQIPSDLKTKLPKDLAGLRLLPQAAAAAAPPKTP